MSSDLLNLPSNDDTLITRTQLPRFIPVAKQTLARWAHEGIGPRHIIIGKQAVYRAGDVREWLQKKSSVSY